MSEQVNEPTEREKDLLNAIYAILRGYGFTAKAQSELEKLIPRHAAEVRAAERARWEAAARELVDSMAAETRGDPYWIRVFAAKDALAALLKDNKNMNNPEHAIPERGNV